ncbi:MAG: molybdopterin dinucleotide binding domain-containing protein [Acidimicrobiales bacterium]|nr:molybdopterin dinucleotide binding domain-containing protein [Acidimicrobiales bacterium]
MGLTLDMGRRSYGPDDPVPTDVEVLSDRAANGPVDHAELRQRPRGMLLPDLAPPVVGAAHEAADERFEILPPDVHDELAGALDDLESWSANGRPTASSSVGRRTMNSLGRRLPGLARHRYNPCFLHTEDLLLEELQPGDLIELRSDHGVVGAVVQPDDTLRRGVVSMTHCFGGEPGVEDDLRPVRDQSGAAPSLSEGRQDISLMPHMTAVPVSIEAAQHT